MTEWKLLSWTARKRSFYWKRCQKHNFVEAIDFLSRNKRLASSTNNPQKFNKPFNNYFRLLKIKILLNSIHSRKMFLHFIQECKTASKQQSIKLDFEYFRIFDVRLLEKIMKIEKAQINIPILTEQYLYQAQLWGFFAPHNVGFTREFLKLNEKTNSFCESGNFLAFVSRLHFVMIAKRVWEEEEDNFRPGLVGFKSSDQHHRLQSEISVFCLLFICKRDFLCELLILKFFCYHKKQNKTEEM